MFQKIRRKLAALMLLVLSACGVVGRCTTPEPVDDAAMRTLYATPSPPPDGALTVFHIGHSLVGKDMPVMLRQLAEEGHRFNSQLGWGAFLRQHWEPDVPVNGFEEENTHPEYADPRDALATGTIDALVLTEAVEIRDAIKYFTPHDYLRKWAVAAWEANPDAKVYLYETWHPLDDPEGWLERIDRDLGLYWEGEILRRALAYEDVTRPIYVIPGGQVMAAFVRRVEDTGGIGAIGDRSDLFLDDIHFNDFGAYLMALTHYAVLYGRSPVGLPHDVTTAGGRNIDDLDRETARAMQETVWDVVTRYPLTGVAQN